MKRTTKSHFAAIHEAVWKGNFVDVQRLLGEGVDPNASSDSGTPLLSYSAMTGNVDIVRELLKAGADVNRRATDGTTPLMVAVMYQLPSVVRVLLDAGADIDGIDQDGRTALWYATDRENEECERLLREHGATKAEIPLSDEEVARRKVEHAEHTRQRLRKVRTKNRQQLAVHLWDAIVADLPQEAIRLINLGADVNYQEEEGDPTVLIWAAHKGYLDVLQAALDADAQVDLFGNLEMAETVMGAALIYAAEAGHVEIVKALIEAGANVEARGYLDDDDGTPLIIATVRGHTEAVRVLLAAGADRNARSRLGRTAKDIALKAGQSEVVRLIEEGLI